MQNSHVCFTVHGKYVPHGGEGISAETRTEKTIIGEQKSRKNREKKKEEK